MQNLIKRRKSSELPLRRVSSFTDDDDAHDCDDNAGIDVLKRCDAAYVVDDILFVSMFSHPLNCRRATPQEYEEWKRLMLDESSNDSGAS